MIHITLSDGSLREYDQPLSVYELAASIGPGLAKAAVAGRVDGILVDCEFMIEADARVSIVTPQEPDGLEILRRSCALMLAMAVKQLHPQAQLHTGAALGDGFFHEFSVERPLTADRPATDRSSHEGSGGDQSLDSPSRQKRRCTAWGTSNLRRLAHMSPRPECCKLSPSTTSAVHCRNGSTVRAGPANRNWKTGGRRRTS